MVILRNERAGHEPVKGGWKLSEKLVSGSSVEIIIVILMFPRSGMNFHAPAQKEAFDQYNTLIVATDSSPFCYDNDHNSNRNNYIRHNDNLI